MEMVDEAACTIETIADNTWVTWAGQLVPNITRRVREEAEVKERLVCEEAKRLVREEAKRIAQRERRQQEKLDLFLNESITAEEFEKDLEEEVERSEALGDVVREDVLGTQTSEMEVDDAGEDKVVAKNTTPKGGRKWAPSSPPKPSRKRAHTLKAIVSKPVVVKRSNSNASAVSPCDRCHHYNILCVPTDEGA